MTFGLDIDLDTLGNLIEQTQFEFKVWCWTLVLLLLFAVILIARDSLARRRSDVLHYRHFNHDDPRWGWRR